MSDAGYPYSRGPVSNDGKLPTDCSGTGSIKIVLLIQQRHPSASRRGRCGACPVAGPGDACHQLPDNIAPGGHSLIQYRGALNRSSFSRVNQKGRKVMVSGECPKPDLQTGKNLPRMTRRNARSFANLSLGSIPKY